MSEPLVSGFDHIHVHAPPEGRENARWFYGALLGLTEIAANEAILSDSSPLCFELADGRQLHVTFGPSPGSSPLPGHLAFRVESAAAVRDRLRANGFDAHTDAGADPHDVRCFCRDPFGNRLEFVERAAARVCGAA